MSLEEPNVLSIGTEVSAKYKGAFCEAKIKKVSRFLRLKVTTKPSTSPITICENEIEGGTVRIGGQITIKHGSNSSSAVVNKIIDQSIYTVVFDDGDEASLKRTSLCLKSGKHFSESESLDQLPLTHPEHFVNPVRRCRRMRQNVSSSLSSRKSASRNKNHGDSDDDGKKTKRGNKNKSRSKSDVGKVVCVEYGDKRGFKNKDIWFPAYVVSVSNGSSKSTKENIDYKVRSFRDDRYYDVSKKDARQFDKEAIKNSYTTSDYSKELQAAIEKALSYIDTSTFPSNWDDMIVPENTTEDSKDDDSNFSKGVESNDEDIDDDDEDDEEGEENEGTDRTPNNPGNDGDENENEEEGSNSDEVESDFSDSESDIEIGDGDDEEEIQERQRRLQKQCEERDMFVAKLYKFMDERGTPINNCPSVNGQEISLYKLDRIVHKMGGFNRVNSRNSWKVVYNKLGLGNSDASTAEKNEENTPNPIAQLEKIYKDYVHPFHELNRKLGPVPVLVDSRFTRAAARPSRGERKREKERDRLNSIGSTASNQSSMTGARKSMKAKNIKNTESSENDQEQAAPTPSSNNNNNKPTREKIEDRRRKKKEENVSGPITAGAITIVEGVEPELAEYQKKVDTKGIDAGDCISVLYGKGKQMKIYDAKVLKICADFKNEPCYYVHYYGWSSRYDEWIESNRINKIYPEKIPQKRSWNKRNKGEPLPSDVMHESSESEEEIPTVRPRKASIKSEPSGLKACRLSDNSKTDPSPKMAAKNARESNEPEKRSRIKEEPVVKIKSENESTRRRTSSFSQQKETLGKASTSVSEDRPTPRRSKISNESTKKAKISVKRSESDEETPTKIPTKKEKEKAIEKEPVTKKSTETEDNKSSTENETAKRKRSDTIDVPKAPDSAENIKKTNEDEYEFVDEDVEESSPPVKRIAPSTSKSFTISDFAKKDTSSTDSVVTDSEKTPETAIRSCETPDRRSPEIKEEPEGAPVADSMVSTVEKEEEESPPAVVTEIDLTQKETAIEDSQNATSLSSLNEDLEVENILSNKQKEKILEFIEKNDSEDMDVGDQSPGPLVVDEEDDNNAEISNAPLKIEPEPDNDEPKEIEVKEEEPNATPETVETEETKEEPVDSLLLCQETLPASPTSPISQKPFVIDDPVDISQDEFYRRSPIMGGSKSSTLMEGSQTRPTTFESFHYDSSSSFSNVGMEHSGLHQFGGLPKAASSRQTSPKEMHSSRLSSPHTKAKISDPNDEEMEDDDEDDDMDDDIAAGIEADVDEFEDDYNEENDRTASRRTRSLDRKRRNHRAAVKVASSIGVPLYSQESSQDGEDHSQNRLMMASESSAALERSGPSKVIKSSTKRLHSSNNDKDDDSSSESQNRGDKEGKNLTSPALSPKKKPRRGRMRTISQSETSGRDNQAGNASTPIKGCKTRGRHRSSNSNNHSAYSNDPFLSRHNQSSNSYEYSSYPSISNFVSPMPQPVDYEILNSYKPISKFNFLTPIDLSCSSEEKCKIFLSRMRDMKKIYNEYKRKLAAFEKKKKKFNKKLKESDKKRDSSKSGGSQGASGDADKGNDSGSGGEEESEQSNDDDGSPGKPSKTLLEEEQNDDVDDDGGDIDSRKDSDSTMNTSNEGSKND